LINECFDGIKTNPKKESYIESGEQERVPTKHEELAAFFGVSRQRIGQLEAAALKKLKAQNSKIELPNFDPHFVTQRWNALSRVPAPRPYLDSCEALGRLVELLLEPHVLRGNEQPLVFQGWPWSKPTIVDDASRVKRTRWPYPRPKFSRDRHIRIAHLRPWGFRQLVYNFLGNAGDAAKIMRIVSWERRRRAPGKPKKRWGYISPAGLLTPLKDYFWPRHWLFPGWFPRPKRNPKSDLVFIRKGQEWIPVGDYNAPEFRGDDGSLVTDRVGETVEFAKGKGERATRLSKTDRRVLGET
jgi:hypothetical protein